MSSSSICPACAQPLVVDGWPSWCESCGWGIVAPPEERPATRLGQLVRSAGTAAAVSLSEIQLLGPAFQAIVSPNAQRARSSDSTVFAELAATAANLTPRERERRRRIARLEDSRLDATHPPTASRIAVLEGRPSSEARVVLADGASERIDEELARYRKEITARLIDEHRDRLYY